MRLWTIIHFIYDDGVLLGGKGVRKFLLPADVIP